MCLFKIYQTGLNAAPYAVPALLVHVLSTTNTHSIKQKFLSSEKRSLHSVIAPCYSLSLYQKKLVSFPRMRLTYLILHVHCGCNTVLVYLPALAASTRAVGYCWWNYTTATTLHYTTLHYTTLHYTTLHYTTLHYTTLHYTTFIIINSVLIHNE